MIQMLCFNVHVQSSVFLQHEIAYENAVVAPFMLHTQNMYKHRYKNKNIRRYIKRVYRRGNLYMWNISVICKMNMSYSSNGNEDTAKVTLILNIV